MKKFLFKSITVVVMIVVASSQASAQGFLKNLTKAAEKLSSSTPTGITRKDTATVKPLKWDMIPVYHAEKRIVTSSDGSPLENEDGTPMVRVLLVDQFNNVRSPEAVKEQHKKLNKAIGNILLKVGGGVALGAVQGLLTSEDELEGALIGGTAGAVAGFSLSSNDIKAAKAQRKSLKQQEKLIAKYQKNFTNEGTPIDASVDVEIIDDIEISEGVSMSAESLKAELESESFNSSDDSAWTF